MISLKEHAERDLDPDCMAGLSSMDDTMFSLFWSTTADQGILTSNKDLFRQWSALRATFLMSTNLPATGRSGIHLDRDPPKP